MKKRFMLLTLIILATTTLVSAQSKTVTDYYLAMPGDVYSTNIEGNKITNKAALTKFRKSLIKTENIKNGYLKLEGTWEGWAEIALFKKKDGSYLIAQAESGCGPACLGFIKFFTYKAGKFTDVTKQVFPNLTDEQINRAFASKNINTEENGTSHYYLLPQKGTTVKMACNMCNDGDEDFTLIEFVWNGDKFTVKK
jgi:hypothetical protein